ncbi:uncharacterized protein BO66DRAFT_209709 [Aspergillus aculeatinus CBS 121060]|uniref:Uncharacterized protein n=1 Tax=Aspergillus aculeatinus CBS 121060 TaxID=1448322 RepID=A0ACD1GVP8_9EURO|nr:hypothetical protein BO66DRAFT_209709 [Aspergillus aculeatinus CBS 121060]RAH65443.1 hypothetical protein BO66DRAFT_209709 [Aspergillus aculeatinus CBS 121060]
MQWTDRRLLIHHKLNEYCHWRKVVSPCSLNARRSRENFMEPPTETAPRRRADCCAHSVLTIIALCASSDLELHGQGDLVL